MDKISIQDIARTLIERNGLSKKDASAFVNAMFDIIQQALERDRVVKVKGLGTFKIIDVDARESVNVNTGERVLIEGHDKITFTPDALMKELVNKPFSQFETVVLKDGVDFDDMAKGESGIEPDFEIIEDPAIIPLVDFEDNTDEPVKILASEPEQEPAPEPEHVPEPESAPEPEPFPVPEPEEESETSSVEEEYFEDETTSSRNWLLPLIACLFGLLIGYLIGNYFPFSNTLAPSEVKVEEPEPVKTEPQPVLADTSTVEAATVDSIYSEPAKTEPLTSEPVETKADTPHPAEASPANQDDNDGAQYEAMDARVRTGAYRIVGTADVIKAREGDNIQKISRRTLGPDMECYVEVYNGLKAASVLKAGQEIKIPKLLLKKKKKPQTVNE